MHLREEQSEMSITIIHGSEDMFQIWLNLNLQNSDKAY